MKTLFAHDGPVMRFLSLLTDLIFLNTLWIICSLPVVTIGASTTACYYVALRMTRGDYSVAKDFFRSFRQNFKQATILWIIFAMLGAFLFFDFQFLEVVTFPGQEAVKIILLALSALCIFAALYAFPLLAQFENKLKTTVKNALMLSFKHIFRTLTMAAVYVLLIDMFIFFPAFALQTAIIWLLYAVSGPVYLCCRTLKPVFAPYLSEAKNEE